MTNKEEGRYGRMQGPGLRLQEAVSIKTPVF